MDAARLKDDEWCVRIARVREIDETADAGKDDTLPRHVESAVISIYRDRHRAIGIRGALHERAGKNRGLDGDSPSLSDADLDRVRRLRDRITLAMDSGEIAAGEELSDLAEGLDLRPRLIPAGDRSWRIRFGAGPEEGVEALAPSVVMGLMELLAAGRWDTIGRCAGAPCCCVFVDRTRNRNRRFCCQLCADRVNQAKARTRSRR